MTSSWMDVAAREAGDEPTESDRPLPPPKGSTKLRRRPLELDAGRLARPARRSLVGRQRPICIRAKIQHSTRCKSYVLNKRSKRGDRDVPRAGVSRCGGAREEAVTIRSGCVGLRARKSRPGGPGLDFDRGSLNPAGVGSFRPGDRRTGRRADARRGMNEKSPRLKSSTMIAARKGLPVSLCGDGAALRTLLPQGYPEACPFCLGKSRGVRAETMAGRMARTWGERPRGNTR
jgi:hypothetical protein